jgi:hypothetical protein
LKGLPESIIGSEQAKVEDVKDRRVELVPEGQSFWVTPLWTDSLRIFEKETIGAAADSAA